MPQCQGLPDGECPNKSKKKEVKHCQGELFLCSSCEFSRFGQQSTRKPRAKPQREQTQEQPAMVTKSTPKSGGKNDQAQDKTPSPSECKLCQKNSTGNTISCERCQRDVCSQCSGLSAELHKMTSEASHHLHWYCPACKQQALKAIRTDQEIEERCNAFMATFKQEIREEMSKELNLMKKSLEQKVESEIATVSTKIEKLEAQVTSQQPNSADSEKLLNEIRDRDVRKLNLIIFNLPESKATEIEKRKEDDQEEIRGLLDKIDALVPFSKCVRLGKAPSSPPSSQRPRPLRITTASVTDQHKVLKAAVKLREIEDYQDVYINKDLTPLEQKNWSRLMEEKRKKIADAQREGKKDITYVIRGGKVVEWKKK